MKKRIVNRRKSYKTRATVGPRGSMVRFSLPYKATDRSGFISLPDGYFVWGEDKKRKK
jgi:hypothetical protein